MDEELKNKISDYFESWELAEYLSISTLDLIEAFEDAVDDRLEDILELLGIGITDE